MSATWTKNRLDHLRLKKKELMIRRARKGKHACIICNTLILPINTAPWMRNDVTADQEWTRKQSIEAKNPGASFDIND